MQLFDPIGMYKGKEISTMTREQLLEFADFAATEIQMLQSIVNQTEESRLRREAGFGSKK